MGLNIRIESNLKAVAKQIEGDPAAHRRVLRGFLSAMAFEGHQHQRQEIPKSLNKPTPFTIRGIAFTRPSAGKLESSVYVKPIQAEYLARMVRGGVRNPIRQFVFIPARSQQTNPYGNMPRSRRRRYLSSDKLRARGKGGSRHVFVRNGSKSEYIGTFARKTKYKGRYWEFIRIATEHYDRASPRIFAAEYTRYLSRR